MLYYNDRNNCLKQNCYANYYCCCYYYYYYIREFLPARPPARPASRYTARIIVRIRMTGPTGVGGGAVARGVRRSYVARPPRD